MDYQEYEIDLHKVLFRSCMKWRKIILIGIIVGLLLGGKQVIDDLMVLNDDEAYTAAQINFDRQHSAWESAETSLNAQIENLTNQKARQEEYNEKSLIMAIDPMDEYYGSFSLYVDSGYQIDPTLGMQNLDYTSRILSAYNRYLTGGELYEYMLANTNLTDEQKYLKEVIGVSVNYDSAMITVSAIGADADIVQELLNLVKNGIAGQYQLVNDAVGQHTYTLVNEVAYSYVNYSLEDTQKDNRDKLAAFDTSIQSINESLEKWKVTPEPRFMYSPSKIFTSTVKKCIIGGIIGVVLGFCWYAAKSILGQDFSEEKLALCAGRDAKIIGFVYPGDSSKSLRGIDKLIARIFGERSSFPDFTSSAAITGSTAGSMAEANGSKKIALVGAIDPKLLESIGAEMAKSSGDCGVDVLGSILSDANAVSDLKQYDCVAIAVQEKVNNITQVSRQFELLKIWGKRALGAVIIR
jgi:hypothetical protein